MPKIKLIFCHLSITFANSLDPDQVQGFVGSELDTLMVFLKNFREKIAEGKKVSKAIQHAKN